MVDPVSSVRVRNQVLASFGGAGAVMVNGSEGSVLVELVKMVVMPMRSLTVIQLRAERGPVSVV